METTMEQHFISNTFWYDAETQDEMAKMLFSQVKMLRDQQLADELERILLNVRLYGNSNIEGLKTFEYNRARDTNKISSNVIKQAVDTGPARIAKSKPRPMFLTEQGTYSNQRDAKKLQRFIDGIFKILQLLFSVSHCRKKCSYIRIDAECLGKFSYCKRSWVNQFCSAELPCGNNTCSQFHFTVGKSGAVLDNKDSFPVFRIGTP